MPQTPTSPHATGGYDTDVLIVGAGPTGLTLATALATRGVRACVIDRLSAGDNTSRAAVVHARTLEVLEPLGVQQTLIQQGLQAQRFTIRDRDRVLVPIAFDELPTRYPYTLMVSQAVTEQVLLERFMQLGGQVLRPRTLVQLAHDDAGATATLDDGSRLRARYLVGCDGMHSTVREHAGIAFSGGSYGESFVLADVHLSGGVPRDEVALFFSPAGMMVVAPLPNGVHRIVAPLDEAPEHPNANDMQSLLDARGPQRERIAGARRVVGFALPRAPPCGQPLPRGPRAVGRRRRPCAQPSGRPGHECRHVGRGEPGRGAGPGDGG